MGKQMTDDLVARLRLLAGRTVDLPTHYEMTEAADRIEELQKQLSVSNKRIEELEDHILDMEYEMFERGERS
jgi:predicted  nucleic acid-binding Zn-ribbon protein